MKYIQLTSTADKQLVLVNVEQIESVIPEGDNTSVYLLSGRRLSVSDDPHEIANMLSGVADSRVVVP